MIFNMIIQSETASINRIIIHKVHKKREEDTHGFAEYSDELFDFGPLELETLKERISAAFSKSKRFFKLEIARSEHDSFFGNATRMQNSSIDEYILASKNIADLLAKSHDKRTIPSGLLLIMDGIFNNKHFVLVVKAELQEAFTIKEIDNHKLIELVNDLFLSPAKDFYKIGYIIQDSNDCTQPNDLHSCYMYDDNFSSGKRDLAEYFYDGFLGFATNRNDKLLTKNFHDDLFAFIESHVQSHEDKKGLKNAVNSLYRENTTGVINPQEFAEQHFSGELLRLFGTEISNTYPHSFAKDLSLVDRRLQRGHIRLVNELRIEGPAETIENDVNVINANNVDFERLRLQIENGSLQVITIQTRNEFQPQLV
jgi:hypothetical protein